MFHYQPSSLEYLIKHNKADKTVGLITNIRGLNPKEREKNVKADKIDHLIPSDFNFRHIATSNMSFTDYTLQNPTGQALNTSNDVGEIKRRFG